MGLIYSEDQIMTDLRVVTLIFLTSLVLAVLSDGTAQEVRMTLTGIGLAFAMTDLSLLPVFYIRLHDWYKRRREEMEDDLRRYSSD
jgi:hypothetical protein